MCVGVQLELKLVEPRGLCVDCRSVKAGSDGVYTTKMAKHEHAGTKVKTEEKYKVTATQTHIYKFV